MLGTLQSVLNFAEVSILVRDWLSEHIWHGIKHSVQELWHGLAHARTLHSSSLTALGISRPYLDHFVIACSISSMTSLPRRCGLHAPVRQSMILQVDVNSAESPQPRVLTGFAAWLPMCSPHVRDPERARLHFDRHLGSMQKQVGSSQTAAA